MTNGRHVVSWSSWEGSSPEQLAWHESGHAVAYWVQGIQLSYVTIVGYERQPRAHTQPVDVNAGTYGQQVLARTAGFVVELQFSRQHITDAGIVELLLGSADDRFELVGMHSGAVLRQPRGPRIGPGEDLWHISLEGAEQAFTAEQAIDFWRDCEQFVPLVAPAVDAVARELLRRGLLTGEQVEQLASAAMVGRPPVQMPPWTAEE
jgi:hypothetical protein